ncbi:MAG: rhomboid family intramembrane serine protease [Syntrophobacterales bacterium CG_4_8_14_3_um_filter_49_14]|nr:MAG: rhomboid family intramembrane serine protease [Syntrophobacterales bacterium CG_4_8_14_3_um_filter_49_14]
MPHTKKNSMLCPNCRKLISADEPVCPYCGLSRPNLRRIINFFSASSEERGSVNVVRAIIYTNISFYILSILLSSSAVGLSANPLTFLSPGGKSLFLLGATGTIPIAEFNRWWTLVSASFLHGGILHIFFNMAALGQLGPFVLREYGFYRFVIIYIATGIVGFFISYLANIPFTIGASGSICGLIGAILYYGKSRGGLYGHAIYKQAMGWVVGLVIFGLLVAGINNWAHGGGIISGALLGFLMGYREKSGETIIHQMFAMGCILLTVVILIWTVIAAIYYHFLLSPLS